GAVRQALAAARRPIPYAELAAQLLAAVPGATPERVEQLIAQLCEAPLPPTALRPPLTTPDPAGWVVDRLSAAGARPEAERLAGLAAEAEALDRAGSGAAPPGRASPPQ